MLLIFVEKITERLKYTLDFVFNERGIQYQITDDKYFFNESNSEKPPFFVTTNYNLAGGILRLDSLPPQLLHTLTSAEG